MTEVVRVEGVQSHQETIKDIYYNFDFVSSPS